MKGKKNIFKRIDKNFVSDQMKYVYQPLIHLQGVKHSTGPKI